VDRGRGPQAAARSASCCTRCSPASADVAAVLDTDGALLSRCAAEAARLEGDIAAQREEIAEGDARLGAARARTEALAGQNAEYAGEIRRLTVASRELAEGGETARERTHELEGRLAAQQEELEELRDALAEKQCAVEQNREDNNELVQYLEHFKAQHDDLQAAVLALRAQNAGGYQRNSAGSHAEICNGESYEPCVTNPLEAAITWPPHATIAD
jgi:uncharacterized coiled-coil protein SlyX